MADNQPGYQLQIHHCISKTDGYEEAVPLFRSSLMQPSALHQLPAGIDYFTGRHSEIDTLVAWSKQSLNSNRTARVMAIAGKAGVGKSTLAIQFAQQIKSSISDQQIYINLRGGENQPLTATQVLASVLRFYQGSYPEIPEEFTQRWRQFQSLIAHQRLLLVLDNADSEEQIHPLIPSNPASMVIVTSRKRLTNLEEAQFFDLAELSESEALNLVNRVSSDRVAADGDAGKQAIQICGRSPLAIAIAGSLLSVQPALSIADWLSKLAQEQQRVEQQHLSYPDVRASFHVTYQHLDAAGARLLRLLGLLPEATITPTMAAALLEVDGKQSATIVRQLVHLKLLKPVGRERYRVSHDLVRLCIRGQLAVEESAEARQTARLRLCRWYLGIAESLALGLNPETRAQLAFASGKGEKESLVTIEQQWFTGALNWFETERSTLLTLMEWAHQTEAWEIVLRLAESLVSFFDAQNDWSTWQQTHKLALEAADRLGDRHATARALNNLGNAYLRQRNWEKAKVAYEQSLDSFQSLSDSLSAAQTLVNLGILYYQQGDRETTITLWKTAIVELTAGSPEQKTMLKWMHMIDPNLLPISISEVNNPVRHSSSGIFHVIGGVIRRLIQE